MKPSGWFWRLPILIMVLALIAYLYVQLMQQRTAQSLLAQVWRNLPQAKVKPSNLDSAPR